ncbi:MAG TPA: hypothetical protein PK776_09665 [Flavobacterium sp.]|nr:hypothetical protein [Flavobacterium sp.]
MTYRYSPDGSDILVAPTRYSGQQEYGIQKYANVSLLILKR